MATVENTPDSSRAKADATARIAAGGGRKPARSRVMRATRWLIILLLLLELSLRFILGLSHPLLYVADAACGYLPKPNQSVRRYFCLNEINADSMRSPPVQAVKPADEFRVLFIGDSVTYGQSFTSQPKIFTSILARDLPARLHRPVEVLNASAVGWAVGNEVGYLRSRGAFQSDLIVLVLNTADLTQKFNDDVAGKMPALPDRNFPTALGEVWTRFISPRLFNVRVADRGSTPVPVSQDDQPVSATLKQLDEAVVLAARNRAKLAIVYSPFIGTNGRLDPDPNGGFTALRQWAQGAGVPILDLTPQYEKASISAVFRDQIHLSPRGHEVVAEAIKQWPEITRNSLR